MEKNFQSAEDILTDELFQAWYFKSDNQKAKAWEQWVEQNPSKQEMVSEAITCMQSIMLHEQEVPQAQTEASHKRLMDNISEPKAPVITMEPARSRKWWWSAAAAILLIVAGTYFWTSMNSQSSFKTAYGQVTQKQLPDGSEVVLNANSSVSYSSGWDEGNEREVWIRGEAFFHVKKTAAKSRFVVHTQQMDIVVTGTQFNVVSRSDKSSVMLTEGSVFLRTKDGKEIRMVPGDFVELSDSQLEKKAVKEETVLAWKEKKIVFDNTPLYEVVRKIQEHYGEKVIIADEALSQIPVTGMMPNDNLDVLLRSLEATAEFTVNRKNGQIVISSPQ
ncbi:MAG TPA: FecR domain-containing protein [Chitinophagaceae bacterium]